MFLLHKQYGIFFRNNNNFIGLIRYFFGEKSSAVVVIIFVSYFSLLRIVVTVIKALIFCTQLFRDKFVETREVFSQNFWRNTKNFY